MSTLLGVNPGFQSCVDVEGLILRVGSGLHIGVGGCYSCLGGPANWVYLIHLTPLSLHFTYCKVPCVQYALCSVHIGSSAVPSGHLDSRIPQPNTWWKQYLCSAMQQQKFCKQQTSAVIHNSTSTSQAYYKVLYNTRIVEHKAVFHWLSSFEMFRREIWVLSSDHSSQKSPNMENVRQKFIFLTLHKLQNVNVFGLLPKALTK